MRILLVLAVMLALPVGAVGAQTSNTEQILKADRLRNEGQPQAAVAILEPLIPALQVQGGSNGLTGMELGVALNVLGSAYQDLQMPAKARAAYDTAMDKLRAIPSGQAKYAAAMANLGSLEDSLGQREPAKDLFEKANCIYEGLGDPGGSTITATTLSMMAYRQKDFKAARRYFARAMEQEARTTTGLGDDDFAALNSVHGALAFHDGHYEESISQTQMAIDRWTHAHGPSYFMLGLAYALRAQATAKLGDYPRALADAQHALAVIDEAHAKNTAGYFRAEIVYARILRDSGKKEQASQLNKDASRSLTELLSRQCQGCTIDVSAFR